MKFTIYAFATLAFVVAACTVGEPRTLESPFVAATNNDVLEVTEVALTDSATTVSFHARYNPGMWIRIARGSRLVAGDKNYGLTGADGIDPDSLFYMPESGEYDFTLTFEPLPLSTAEFDFTEGTPDGWVLYGIDATGKGEWLGALWHRRHREGRIRAAVARRASEGNNRCCRRRPVGARRTAFGGEPRTLESPFVAATNNDVLEVTEVALTDSATTVSFHARYNPGMWIRIARGSRLVAGDKNYGLTGADGIDPDSLFYMPESGEYDFTLTFEPLPLSTAEFDFTEGMPDGWALYGIDATGKGEWLGALCHRRHREGRIRAAVARRASEGNNRCCRRRPVGAR